MFIFSRSQVIPEDTVPRLRGKESKRRLEASGEIFCALRFAPIDGPSFVSGLRASGFGQVKHRSETVGVLSG